MSSTTSRGPAVTEGVTDGRPATADEQGGDSSDAERRQDTGELERPVHGAAEKLAEMLGPIWADWRIGVAIAVAIAGSWGLLAGSWTPRGPVTPAQALWSMVISVVVGGAAGLVARSRWAIVVAPAVFAMMVEIARTGTDGPTVDGLHLSTYGVLALVVGRGFHALLTLLPMALGAALGAGAARTIRRRVPADHRLGRLMRRVVAGLVTLGLIALGLGISRPARTDPIVDASGNVLPDSIAELTTVDVGDHDLAVLVRGHDVENPVLLFLAGGPGGSEMGSMRNHLAALEESFTVVTLDQRGTGKSYRALDPTDTVTLDGALADAMAVTDYLRNRFGHDKIYVLGQSWGSLLGVLAVKQQPDRFHAFIGTGQMVSPRETDRLFYAHTLDWARANGDDALVERLTDIGPPPYDDILNYETALSYEQDVYPYDHSVNSEGEGQMSENLIADEYTLVDEVHILAGFLDTFAVLYPQIQGVDLRDDAIDFDVPMFFVQGAHEADGRAVLFDEWYPTITAPAKDLVVLDTSGHRPLFEQPDEFVDAVRRLTEFGDGS